MTLTQINYFIKVGQCMSYTLAAEQLFISQPALSRQIALLEEELELRLFDRAGKQMSFTPIGEALYECFVRCRKDYNDTIRLSSTESFMKHNILRIGVYQYWHIPKVLSRLNHDFCSRHPNIGLSFELTDGKNLLKNLYENRYDMVICNGEYISGMPNLESTPLREVRRFFVLSSAFFNEETPAVLQNLQLFSSKEEVFSSKTKYNEDIDICHKNSLDPLVRKCRTMDEAFLAIHIEPGFAVADEYFRDFNAENLRLIEANHPAQVCAVWKSNSSNELLREVQSILTDIIAE